VESFLPTLSNFGAPEIGVCPLLTGVPGALLVGVGFADVVLWSSCVDFLDSVGLDGTGILDPTESAGAFLPISHIQSQKHILIWYYSI
jgi:hypothetical protein